MIKKNRLLSEIDSLINLDKSIVPLLTKHISSSLFFSVLKEGDRNAILEKFQNIAVTKTKHLEALNGIRNEIMKGKNDVY